jgi:hypothetical protein
VAGSRWTLPTSAASNPANAAVGQRTSPVRRSGGAPG